MLRVDHHFDVRKGGADKILDSLGDRRMSVYTREERIKAVELYIKHQKNATPVIRALGYPGRKTLPRWYKIYIEEQETGILHYGRLWLLKHPLEDRKYAVQCCIENGCNYTKTSREIGYPGPKTLKVWCDELAPGACKERIGKRYNIEDKRHGVEVFCSREVSSYKVSAMLGISRSALYKWKIALLGKECENAMADQEIELSSKSKEELLSEIELLKKQMKRLKLENDVLEATNEIIKKDPGVDRERLTNKEKTLLIGALRKEHPLKELIDYTGIKRSTYFYHLNIQRNPVEDKYSIVKERIISLFKTNNRCYGYRRIYAALVREGKKISEKIVRFLMKENSLIVYGKKKLKYSSYLGENAPSVENIIKRDFHADAPNAKWLTDITEFHIPTGKIYLSPVIDCFDGIAVSWTIGTHPDSELANSMLDMAISTLKPGEHPIIHSDRGCHYRWPGWISRADEAKLIRSMSKKACSPDNSACEGFFGRLKNEMFYNRTWSEVSIDEFIKILDEYIHWYNEKRIKISLGAMSPLEYRRSLNLAA